MFCIINPIKTQNTEGRELITPKEIIFNFYLSTGSKEVFYTLKQINTINGVLTPETDTYIKNLSTNLDEAISNAEKYIEKINQLFPHVQTVLFIEPENTPFVKHGLKLTGRQVNNLRLIYLNKIPFGKHAYKKFSELPHEYILWAIKSMKDSLDYSVRSLSGALFAYAVEIELIKSEQDVERTLNEIYTEQAKESKSKHLGKIKERLTLDVEILTEKSAYTDGYGLRGQTTYSFTLKAGEDMLYYRGSKYFGKIGEQLKINATVVEHFEMNGIKFTKINRPSLA